ncbi:MFS transporter [Actinoplanes sp. CA-142083]|uniref:MFS transporter n=1 Tax=Actinoplanes sp. CA-142083 TaxID=3239903 RepID=UPI003D8A952A
MAAGAWQLRRFRLFWTGDTISSAGGALSAVALPLLAIETLHASDTQVGVLRAAQTLPFLLLAVPIGLLADRVSRRRLLLAADAVRVPLVGAIALTGASLPVSALVTLVFVTGIATVAYEVAYLSALPDLVDSPASLPAANRAVESSHATAALLGPAAGGALVAAMSAPAVIALDAVSFAVGAALTAINRWERPRPAPPPAPASTALAPARPPTDPVDAETQGSATHHAAGPASNPPRGLAAGWQWLRRDPYVRPLTLYLAANNLAAQAFQTALLLFVTRTLGLGAGAVGLAVAAIGGGFLGGALASPAMARRFGTGRLLIAASMIGATGIATAAGPTLAFVLAGSALSGIGSGLFNLHSIAIRQAITPPGLLGRVNATVKTVSYGATTVGAVLGGLAAAASGPPTVIVTAALVSAAATGFLLTPAVRTLAGTPAAR